MRGAYHCYESRCRTFWILNGKWEKDWRKIIKKQQCPFLGKKCYKVRKSDPNTAIGSCTVLYGKRLVQMHHKIQTFEHVHKKLVLVTQDKLISYVSREFDFEHLKNPAVLGHSMHFHSYSLEKQKDFSYKLFLQSRLSTDTEGVSLCLGLQTESRIELEQMIQTLEDRLSPNTLFKLSC